MTLFPTLWTVYVRSRHDTQLAGISSRKSSFAVAPILCTPLDTEREREKMMGGKKNRRKRKREERKEENSLPLKELFPLCMIAGHF